MFLEPLPDPTSLRVAIERGVRSEVRPFAEAVRSHDAPTAGERAVGVWRLTLQALFEPLVSCWSRGTSVDPFDGVATMTVDAAPP
ncbi:MAG: hypothetical protein AAFP84_19405, partial [Actinomycetota bacterium]